MTEQSVLFDKSGTHIHNNNIHPIGYNFNTSLRKLYSKGIKRQKQKVLPHKLRIFLITHKTILLLQICRKSLLFPLYLFHQFIILSIFIRTVKQHLSEAVFTIHNLYNYPLLLLIWRLQHLFPPCISLSDYISSAKIFLQIL